MPSIYDSFSTRLPVYTLYGNQESSAHKTHVSGRSTASSTPPRFGVKIPTAHWTGLASRLCLIQKAANLRNIPAPESEDLIAFKSEADVVNTATLYLSHPVHKAYELVHPGDVSLNEVYRHQKNDTIGSARVDKAYFKGKPSDKERPGNSRNIFALVEYKKIGTIDQAEFERGMARDEAAFVRLDIQSPFADPDSNPSDDTSGDTNEVVLLKQATHYTNKYRTPFVALCDYHTLLLLVMSKAGGGQTGGRYAYMTVVTDPKEMRKAYLGFLLAARAHASNDASWRQNAVGTDIFQDAEGWDARSTPAHPATNSPRRARNNNPVHDSPDSSQGDVPMTGLQRGGIPQTSTYRNARPAPSSGGHDGRKSSQARDSSASSFTSSRSASSASSATTTSSSSAASSPAKSATRPPGVATAAAAARGSAPRTTADNTATTTGHPKNKVPSTTVSPTKHNSATTALPTRPKRLEAVK